MRRPPASAAGSAHRIRHEVQSFRLGPRPHGYREPSGKFTGAEIQRRADVVGKATAVHQAPCRPGRPRHSVLFARESALYVDYIKTDEGHMWQEPWLHSVMLESGLPYHTPRVVGLVRSLHAVGIATADALRVVADTWRPVAWTPDFHRRDLRALNSEMLERLGSIAADDPAQARGVIVERWLFPLYSVDLSPIKVSQDALRAYQDDYWYRQMGV